MFTKSNWMIWAGAVIMLAAGVYFWSCYRVHAPSPFDIADAQGDGEEFIPILQAVEDIGTGKQAPTLEGFMPDTGLGMEDAAATPAVAGSLPDRILIPSIYLDAPVVPVHYKDIESGGKVYHQWRVPAEFAVGWQDESALPGQAGNMVLNGHHNAYGMVFKDLVKLSPGDLIIVRSGRVEYRYTVVAKMLLPERGQTLESRMENARWLAASEDERLTLVTCWPADSNTHRVIVVAFPEGAPPP